MNVLMERKDFQPGFIYVAHRIGIKESHALMSFALFSSAECLLCGLMIRLKLSIYGPPLNLPQPWWLRRISTNANIKAA